MFEKNEKTGKDANDIISQFSKLSSFDSFARKLVALMKGSKIKKQGATDLFGVAKMQAEASGDGVIHHFTFGEWGVWASGYKTFHFTHNQLAWPGI